jgi:hypothetical protein
MKILEALTKPSLEEAYKLVEQATREKLVVLLVGQCIVNYVWRAGSVLPQGERIVIMKPDGTLLVHRKDKREPVNWNPPGCRATARLTKEGCSKPEATGGRETSTKMNFYNPPDFLNGGYFLNKTSFREHFISKIWDFMSRLDFISKAPANGFGTKLIQASPLQ